MVFLAALAGPVRAQPSAASLRHTVEVLAHDSMAGRATGSAELEAAAQYIGAQWRAAGLKPFGDDSGWFQRFPVANTVMDADSVWIRLGEKARWRFGADFHHIGGFGDPIGTLRGPAVIVTGDVTRQNAGALGVEGKVVIYIGPLDDSGRVRDYRPAFALGSGARTFGRRPGQYPRRGAVDRWAAQQG